MHSSKSHDVVSDWLVFSQIYMFIHSISHDLHEHLLPSPPYNPNQYHPYPTQQPPSPSLSTILLPLSTRSLPNRLPKTPLPPRNLPLPYLHQVPLTSNARRPRYFCPFTTRSTFLRFLIAWVAPSHALFDHGHTVRLAHVTLGMVDGAG